MSIDIKAFIDINQIIAEAKILLQQLYADDYPEVKEAAATYLEDSKQRLILLAQNRLSNEIDDKFMLERLKDEKDIFISELLSFSVIGKAIAQQAANTYIEFLTQKVTEALGKLQQT